MGPATGRLVAGIMSSRPHPEQGYRACLGIMRLGRHHGDDRLEAACARAEQLRSYSYRTVKNILASAQERLPLEDEQAAPAPTPSHHDIRGRPTSRTSLLGAPGRPLPTRGPWILPESAAPFRRTTRRMSSPAIPVQVGAISQDVSGATLPSLPGLSTHWPSGALPWLSSMAPLLLWSEACRGRISPPSGRLSP
jgi:hypothetical protein